MVISGVLERLVVFLVGNCKEIEDECYPILPSLVGRSDRYRR